MRNEEMVEVRCEWVFWGETNRHVARRESRVCEMNPHFRVVSMIVRVKMKGATLENMD